MLFDASVAVSFLKHSDKRRNCSKRAISPFDTMFSGYPFNYRDFLFLTKYIQSCLLQNCHMRERVKEIFIFFTIDISYQVYAADVLLVGSGLKV